jgi:SAM-dependent methyltransferase
MKIPMGVMDSSYASKRNYKSEFIFRYKVRAMSVLDAAPLIKNGNLLDLGSADGLTLKELISLASPKQAIGIELSDDLLSHAKANGVNVIKGDVENLPSQITSSHFTIVTALALIEHLENPLACFKEVHRVLRPGGIFVASAPNPFWDNLSSKLHIHKEQSHHQQEITPSKFKELVEKAGLQFTGFKPFMFAPIAFLPYLKIVPSVKLSCYIDNILQHKFTAPLFVNQLFTARKPID